MTTAANTAFRPQAAAHADFDVYKVRADFPILARTIHGKPLVYLDNAATTQKPQAVIDTMVRYYTAENSNIHRGVHTLSEQATQSYEQARATVRQFLNAGDPREIIFVRGTTEGINLVAQTWGRANIGREDEIVISAMEHHSNIVPWQILCEQQGANLQVAPVNDAGELMLHLARNNDAVIWDELTREVFAPDAWQKQRLEGWDNSAAGVSAVTRGVPVASAWKTLLGITRAALAEVPKIPSAAREPRSTAGSCS